MIEYSKAHELSLKVMRLFMTLFFLVFVAFLLLPEAVLFFVPKANSAPEYWKGTDGDIKVAAGAALSAAPRLVPVWFRADAWTTFCLEVAHVESNVGMPGHPAFLQKQLNGPALGPFQVEPSTARDLLWRVGTEKEIKEITGFSREELNGRKVLEPLLRKDALLGAYVLLLKYSSLGFKYRGEDVSRAFRSGSTLAFRARAWKAVWNTHLGKGTEEGYTNRVKGLGVK